MARVGMRANDCDGAVGKLLFFLCTILVGQCPLEEGYLACHRQGRPDPGGLAQTEHWRKRWEDIRRWSKKTAAAQLGMTSQRGRVARRTMTPLMFRILVVAYPELDGRLRASQQLQGGEYTLILLIQYVVEVSGWGRWAVGSPRPGRVC
ncbi:hypothetical protein NDU88_005298 [Pleurodeles waltl]|uniref:Uncharacterized protein n=1 Tax=Pleurodeles waltl TaxID=8319 RepID=A0AAV7SLF4_PLEWA|nr:hypothetical protein NDU88_005298 [Pleurodeles waltl]